MCPEFVKLQFCVWLDSVHVHGDDVNRVQLRVSQVCGHDCSAQEGGGQAELPGGGAGQDSRRGQVNNTVSQHCIAPGVQNSLLYSISPWSLAVKRVPALILTMSLELMGGVVIDQLHKVRAHYILTGVITPLHPPPAGDQGLHSDRELHARHLCTVW